MPTSSLRPLVWAALAAVSVAGMASAQQPMPCATSGGTRPSDVFFDGSSIADRSRLNTKNPAHTVVCDIEIAGWLVGVPDASGGDWRNHNDSGLVEDVHFAIQLDPDFIAAKYGPGSVLWIAALPGHLEQVGVLGGASDPAVPPNEWLPVADYNTDGTRRGITVNSFLLPNNGSVLDGELNAWWSKVRGAAPNGWYRDPQFPDVYWAFNPLDPDGGGPLKVGDYVIMRGTLWEDGGHIEGWACSYLGSGFCADEELKCWNSGAISPDPPAWPAPREMDVHGGWLEIHPVSSIRRATPPAGPRKTVIEEKHCGVTQPTRNIPRIRDWTIKPDGPRPPNTHIAYTQLIDGRFTDMRSVDTLRIDTLRAAGQDTALNVHLRATSTCIIVCGNRPARFKATYVLWWDPLTVTQANAPPPPTLKLVVREVGATATTNTVVVDATDSRSGQEVKGATVSLYGVRGTTYTRFTYPKTVPLACRETGIASARASGGDPVPGGRAACIGIVEKAGYENAYFDPPAPPLPAMTVGLQSVATTPTTKTIVVRATDAITGQALPGAVVWVHGVSGSLGAPITYPIIPSPECSRSGVAGPAVAPAGLSKDEQTLMCTEGIVVKPGYQTATFKP